MMARRGQQAIAPPQAMLEGLMGMGMGLGLGSSAAANLMMMGAAGLPMGALMPPPRPLPNLAAAGIGGMQSPQYILGACWRAA